MFGFVIIALMLRNIKVMGINENLKTSIKIFFIVIILTILYFMLGGGINGFRFN